MLGSNIGFFGLGIWELMVGLKLYNIISGGLVDYYGIGYHL